MTLDRRQVPPEDDFDAARSDNRGMPPKDSPRRATGPLKSPAAPGLQPAAGPSPGATSPLKSVPSSPGARPDEKPGTPGKPDGHAPERPGTPSRSRTPGRPATPNQPEAPAAAPGKSSPTRGAATPARPGGAPGQRARTPARSGAARSPANGETNPAERACRHRTAGAGGRRRYQDRGEGLRVEGQESAGCPRG